MTERRSFLARVFRAADGLRRITLNLVFFGILGLLLAGVIAGLANRKKVPSGAALVLQPKGVIVEQLSASDPLQRILADQAGAGSAARETLLKDLVDALREAKDDKRINSLYLDLNELSGSGMSKLRDLRDALAEFRKSGKKVVAYSDNYMQTEYYLAAHADEVYLNPDGVLLLEGFGRYRNYYREGLDRLGVDVHVFRVGEYKSAVEPFLRKDMSPESREMSMDVYGDLWRDYLSDVAAARKLRPEDVTALVDSLPDRLTAARGDLARVALDAKLVDKLATRDEVRRRMIELAGEDKDKKTFKQIGHGEYLAALGKDRSGAGRGDAVAVVVAKGEILDGTQPAGTIGGDSTARLIRQAREDDSVKAVVLRVDSPGGSAFASEVIRRECELTRTAGKPVIVSMGSVAASGGYWIATASDEIWASPDTITGSIGIFGLFLTIDKPLARHLGVYTDGAGTTRFSDALRPDRPLDPVVAQMFQQVIDHGYEQFLTRVSQARRMTRDQVDRIARGRIWSGQDAKGLGLVDQLGGLDQAIEAAATRAKLAKGYRVWYVEKEKSFKERLAGMLTASVGTVLRDAGVAGTDAAASATARRMSVAGRLRDLQVEAERLSRWNDPRGIYAHCLCDPAGH